MPLLSIGTSVYDDYDGLFFTFQAIKSCLPDMVDDIEFVIVNNNPSSASGKAAAEYANKIGAVYAEFKDHTATSVKGKIFDHATGEYVLCLDSHVLLLAGSLDILRNYLCWKRPEKELIHGPLYNERNKLIATHMDPVWRGNMLGVWGTRKQDFTDESDSFEIPQSGMGLFCCKRDFWPGFNPDFRGFGGEEGYIHEKVRQRGGIVTCLPGLRWIHRFTRPNGVAYKVTSTDKCANYIIGFAELSLDLKPIEQHFGAATYRAALKEIKRRTGKSYA